MWLQHNVWYLGKLSIKMNRGGKTDFLAHYCIFSVYKIKKCWKSASGGQCLTDRQFQRYVSCRLNTCEHFHTNFFLTPRGLIGQICDLRKANLSTFKWLCLPDRTEFDRFSSMCEFVWTYCITWYQKLDFHRAMGPPLS